MAVSVLRRLAAQAPVPVVIVPGPGARDACARLRASSDLDSVTSPRHATVLLVVGAVPSDHLPALSQLHDQVPGPRAALWWTAQVGDLPAALQHVLPEVVVVDSDPVDAVRSVHTGLLGGERPSSAPVGPDENPTAWQGVGPHGQGGEGMMGGQPYGRSMAMTGEDVRDGLQLDRVPLTVGPYHAALPAGLTLDLELQGDVVVGCDLRPVGAGRVGTDPGAEPVDPVAAWVADLLRVHNLGERATGLLRAALAGDDVTARLADARRRLRWSLEGVGVLDDADALHRLDTALSHRRLPEPPAADRLADELVGREWSDLVATLWSLDHRQIGAEVPA